MTSECVEGTTAEQIKQQIGIRNVETEGANKRDVNAQFLLFLIALVGEIGFERLQMISHCECEWCGDPDVLSSPFTFSTTFTQKKMHSFNLLAATKTC